MPTPCTVGPRPFGYCSVTMMGRFNSWEALTKNRMALGQFRLMDAAK